MAPASIVVERLGPVRRAKLELGDVTLITGPHNAGKSYILRAVYARLAALDRYASKQLRAELARALRGRFLEELRRGVMSRAGRSLRAFTTLTAVLAAAAAYTGSCRSPLALAGGVTVTQGAEGLTVHLGPVNLPATLINTLVDALEEAHYRLASRILPVDKTTRITLKPWPTRSRLLQALAGIEARDTLKPHELSHILQPLQAQAAIHYTKMRHPGQPTPWTTPQVELHTTLKPAATGPTLTMTAEIPCLETAEPTTPEIPEAPKARRDTIDAATATLLRTALTALMTSLSDQLVAALQNTLRETLQLEAILPIPHGAPLLLEAVEKAALEHTPSKPIEYTEKYHTILHTSYTHHATRARNNLQNNHPLLQLATPLLRGRIELRDNKLHYIDSHNTATRLHTASTLALQATALTLPLLAIQPPALILIEQPETHLDTEAQKTLAILLAALTTHGIKTIATTHSKTITETITRLAIEKPTKQEIKKQLQQATEDNIDVDRLAEAAAKAAKEIKARIYRLEKGTIKPTHST